MKAKQIQDIIDEADCNAEVNFTGSKHQQRVPGWAKRLIEVSFEAGYMKKE